ncbi:glycosyltransferase family 4 protein [Microbacter margulisiae]|uniref:Glycosyltransferase involved in cell wall biosynthesis n=1 Tax=Microbacter margulisiae TaxID=1350067 RepID=A0A7W5DQG4_9PORP|nr:glycosyltransferase family 4 protein [Microbacter margulisiae]MBB3187195.1 glycosyltransferase involved in cell wall biosynthesis [Microbacter margulisiae]
MATILFSDNHLWALYHFRGGVIKNLLNQGYKVVVVAPETNDLEDNSIQGVEFIPIKLNRTTTSIYVNIQYFISLCKIYHRIKPDVIFHYTIKPILFGNLAAKLNHIFSVSIFAGLSNILTEDSLINKIMRLVLKYALRFSVKTVFLNEDDRRFLISKQVVPEKKSVLYESGEGLDTDFYKPNSDKNQNNHLVFLMISRLLYQKGYSEYVEAARMVKIKFPSAEFILCGEIDNGHPSAVPKDVVMNDHNCGVIIYEGRITNVLEKMQSSDCFVLPSYYNEGMNRSLMEALSIGVPIITTDNKGCREMVIDGETGFLVKQKCVGSLVDAMMKICKMSQSEREEMGIKGRQLAINVYDEKHVFVCYNTIIDFILCTK